MEPARAKAPRQAIACEWCRSHKLKCDCEQPSCRNCAKRGVPCITTNLRKPGAEGRRQPPRGRRGRARASMHGTASETASCSPSPAEGGCSSDTGRSCETRTSGGGGGGDDGDSGDGGVLPAIFATPFDSDSRARAARRRHAADHGPLDRPSTPPLVLDAGGAAPRSQILGNASSRHVLVQWLDLYFRQSRDWQPVFPLFRLGLAHAAELPLPFLTALPPLPPAAQMAASEALFFAKIYPVFPVLDRARFGTALAALRRTTDAAPGGASLRARDYPLLACAYAVASLAADEEACGASAAGTRYLEAGYALYAQLVAAPYVASVQALLLLTLALRNRNKDAACWGSLGQAIRIAQALGLHRRAATPLICAADAADGADAAEPAEAVDADLHARVWWTAYMLERTLELETGRPSAIRDDECDQQVPAVDAPGTSFGYFAALVGLAKIQTRAVRLLFGSRRQRKPIQALLVELGQIDRALLDWADAFPESIRPGRDLFCGPDELPLATYVALQFYQTMISLHRPALMSEPGFLRSRINEYCTGTPWRDRLHYSLCIGAASARGILKAVNDLMLYASRSRMVTADQILLAVLVLGIYVTKVRMSRLNQADLALADTFGELVEEEYVRSGHSPDFVRGISLLRTQLADYLSRASSGRTMAALPRATSSHPEQEARADAVPDRLSSRADLAQLEESWSHFWNEDLESLLLDQPGEYTTDMYLLGIPQSGSW